MIDLSVELKRQEEKLFNCVHCGFCLPACPTYTRLGDEADSPRGRLHFMRAVVDGRLPPSSGAFHRHLDRCLGCRACESVCPSGVEYGRLLEGARDVAAGHGGTDLLSRVLSAVMGSPALLGPAMALTRGIRATAIPRVLVDRLPDGGRLGQLRLGMGMIAATTHEGNLIDANGAGVGVGPAAAGAGGATGGKFRPAAARAGGTAGGELGPAAAREGGAAAGEPASGIGRGEVRTAVLLGCIQEGLLSRVNRATERVLRANGFHPVSVKGLGCCGALHAHTGDLDGARKLARRNILALEASGVDRVAVNAAGCGAIMKDYGHLLRDDPEFADRAEAMATRTADISEVLVGPALVRGGPLQARVTYDAPCHLLHAQRVSKEPLDLLTSIPGLEVVPLPGHDECCGGAGVYGITHAELGGRIGKDKVAAILSTGAQIVATGNPGCMMQIGAGLRMAGAAVEVVHPVELLDESYRRGGVYS